MTTTTAQPQAPPVGRKRTDDPSVGHLPALDGVRGLAILLVMATHFTLVQQGILIDRIVGPSDDSAGRASICSSCCRDS